MNADKQRGENASYKALPLFQDMFQEHTVAF